MHFSALNRKLEIEKQHVCIFRLRASCFKPGEATGIDKPYT